MNVEYDVKLLNILNSAFAAASNKIDSSFNSEQIHHNLINALPSDMVKLLEQLFDEKMLPIIKESFSQEVKKQIYLSSCESFAKQNGLTEDKFFKD